MQENTVNLQKAMGAIVNTLAMPVPYPYFHLLNLLLFVNYTVRATRHPRTARCRAARRAAAVATSPFLTSLAAAQTSRNARADAWPCRAHHATRPASAAASAS